MWLKKHLFIIILASVTFLFVAADVGVIIWANSQKMSNKEVDVDLKDYVLVTKEGFSTEAEAEVDIERFSIATKILTEKKYYGFTELYEKNSIFPFINSALSQRVGKTMFAMQELEKMIVGVSSDKTTGLKNGDIIKITCEVDEDIAKKYNVKFTDLEFDYKIDKLEEGKRIDPFKDCVVSAEVEDTYSDRDYVTASEIKIRNKEYPELNDYYEILGESDGYYSDSEYYSGDKINIYISEENVERIKEDFGYLLTRTEKRVKLKVKNPNQETTTPSEREIETRDYDVEDGSSADHSIVANYGSDYQEQVIPDSDVSKVYSDQFDGYKYNGRKLTNREKLGLAIIAKNEIAARHHFDFGKGIREYFDDMNWYYADPWVDNPEDISYSSMEEKNSKTLNKLVSKYAKKSTGNTKASQFSYEDYVKFKRIWDKCQ